MAKQARLYLASASPRRRELLEQIGVGCQVRVANIPEMANPGESGEEFVLRLALAKARAVWDGLAVDETSMPVLGADTVVVLDGLIMGKPRNREEGLAMLARLAGREHKVLTAVAMVGEKAISRLSISKVRFRDMTAQECNAYWESGEPTDKAGAYGIQGRAAVFIASLEGSYSGVMGLPLFETAELLSEFGINVFD